ncbi:hypothetical protein B0H17DRAFT_1212952 [Mycena rosella]|uniref:Uncharacterized protein n=1 Tax=Mycena rosella TaxID=1033263 RepID=A0AAD7CTX1_MYCRO|nr:hypothetical protein B0H17DRAFT_1212952 [Mycena rosella]
MALPASRYILVSPGGPSKYVILHVIPPSLLEFTVNSGTLEWTCGYFEKTTLEQHLEEKDKDVEEVKRNIAHDTERELREAETLQHDDQEEIEKQKQGPERPQRRNHRWVPSDRAMALGRAPHSNRADPWAGSRATTRSEGWMKQRSITARQIGPTRANTIPVPVRGRRRAMPVWSYIGVVGAVGVPGANPGDGGPRAYGDGDGERHSTLVYDADGDRSDTDVADVDAESAEDVEAELASEDAVALAVRRPTGRTAGTEPGTGEQSLPSTGWRDCSRSGRICDFVPGAGIGGAAAPDADGGPPRLGRALHRQRDMRHWLWLVQARRGDPRHCARP